MRIRLLVPIAAVVLALLYLVPQLAPRPTDSQFDLEAFGRIPVSAEGRIKPLDTVARNTLMRFGGKQTIRDDGRKIPAIEWLADLLSHRTSPANPSTTVAASLPIFRIDHPDLLDLLGVTPEQKKNRFSFDELFAHRDAITRQAGLAFQVDAKKRGPYQRRIVGLYDTLSRYIALSRYDTPYAVPPLTANEQWRPLGEMLMDGSAGSDEAAASLTAIFNAYAAQNSGEFNDAVADYLRLVRADLPGATRKAGYETLFNRMTPFYHASALYVYAFLLSSFAFMLTSLSKPDWARALGRGAIAVLVLAFFIHTIGIISRIYLQGRPPVTNLYSSAVFIGWICVMLGFVIEKLFRLGIGTIAAAAIGFVTLVIAHNLSSGGDTMEMMQAVLDSNFWLSTHVVCITIGYSATFLAGFLGITYILLGVLTPVLKPDRAKALARMIYGVICFAALMSFVGTVLGGIWADQSWGRFWGWDPKENGAALIVIWLLIILHARWGEMVRERGVAVLAVAGNIVTSWSWFGTNMLGVGLHSYGFTDSAVFWMLTFATSQLAIMALGMLPIALWRSTGVRAINQRSPTPRVATTSA